jgi:pre-rRNA-processing protein TSR4
MASTVLSDSIWRNGPSYPALYLSTTSEYIPPPPKTKASTKDQHIDDHDSKDVKWISEAYENSLDVDNVFEKFSKRVGYEGEQCVR